MKMESQMSDEQLLELAAKFFPQVPQEKVIQMIQELKKNIPEINNEQIMLIASERLGKQGEAPAQPEGRFTGLKGKLNM